MNNSVNYALAEWFLFVLNILPQKRVLFTQLLTVNNLLENKYRSAPWYYIKSIIGPSFLNPTGHSPFVEQTVREHKSYVAPLALRSSFKTRSENRNIYSMDK